MRLLTFKSVDETLVSCNSNESYGAEILFGTVHFVVQQDVYF